MKVAFLDQASSEFMDVCDGNPSGIGISFEMIHERLEAFKRINLIVIEKENDLQFNVIQDEINYYKIHKPEFQKYGIFYQLVYTLELYRTAKPKKYYKATFRKLDKEYKQLMDYFVYYREKSTHLDPIYFTRESKENHIFALIKAKEMLVEYLNFKTTESNADEYIASTPGINFDMKQNDVIELAKAFKGTGAANGSLESIAQFLGRCFGVQLKDIHGKSYVISNRLNPAAFLEKQVRWLKRNL